MEGYAQTFREAQTLPQMWFQRDPVQCLNLEKPPGKDRRTWVEFTIVNVSKLVGMVKTS